MVSRKRFIPIFLMMLLLFAIFQSTGILKESGEDYGINSYLTGQRMTKSERGQSIEGKYILLVSKEDAPVVDVATQWAEYKNRGFVHCSSMDELPELINQKPEMLLVDASALDSEEEVSRLLMLTKDGVNLVLCNLPGLDVVETSNGLKQLLGIYDIKGEVTVEGVRVFNGFLLGGEANYLAVTEEEKKRQDFDLTIPWYVTLGKTKTYMVGLMDEDVVKREYFPSIIWRNSCNQAQVFVVNGDYMSTMAGIGILDGFAYELDSYCLYPVVNAQNVVIVNFPSFAAENDEVMKRLYCRNSQTTFRDVMWTSLYALCEVNHLKLTCMLRMQYDYEDDKEPDATPYEFYLRQLRQLRAEAGLSLGGKDNTRFLQAVKADEDFLESIQNTYCFQVGYLSEAELSEIKQPTESSLLAPMVTVTIAANGNAPLLSYLTDDITLQKATGDAESYTYTDDFTKRSLETALGYSTVLLDLYDAVWPQGKNHQWEIFYEKMAANISSYWNHNEFFTRTTLSESDIRVRNFLNVDYESQRDGDTVYLTVSPHDEPLWFMLRTHQEEILSVAGGSVTELEDGMYLIEVTGEQAKIVLKNRELGLKG